MHTTTSPLKTISNLLFLLFGSATLNAQIVYTDIPDATPNATYSLDLNNDGNVDFVLYFGGSAGNVGVLCSPQQNNAYAGNVVGSDYLAWALASSTSICDSLSSWYGTNYPGTLGVGSNTGYWPGATDRYLALKLVVGTNTYFGWVRLDVFATSTSFTVKDYAYNSTPNACIQAGQTTLSLEESNDAALTIFPNPFSSSTTIQTAGNLNDATLIVSDAYGQTVKRFEHLSGQSITISRDDLPNGLYFFRLEKGEVIVVLVD
ncbi:MAG: hypothetical protein RL632_2319 [Bacteroidota bacterium]|jgi:hypothetical protein